MSQFHPQQSDYENLSPLSVEQKLHVLLRFAILSPSSLNTQPWRFQIHDNGVDVYADDSKSLPVADPEGRELAMSAGAVASRLALAMRFRGLQPKVEYVNDFKNPDLLIRISCVGECRTSPLDMMLMSQIERRHSIAKMDEGYRVSPTMLHDLTSSAADSLCELVWIGHGELRRTIADMVAEADRRLFSDRGYRKELASWVHANDIQEFEGVPASTLGLGGLKSIFAPWVVGHTYLGDREAKIGKRKAITAPALGILLTPHDLTKDWLDAGQALSSVLLRASYLGLACELFNQPLELPGIRNDLRRVMSTDKYPQAILRVAIAPEADHLPRRPVDTFVTPEEVALV